MKLLTLSKLMDYFENIVIDFNKSGLAKNPCLPCLTAGKPAGRELGTIYFVKRFVRFKIGLWS
jgi:hypothetical protein